MIEDHLRISIKRFADIVHSLESIEFYQEERISILKAKILLFDGTILQIREVEISGKIDAYSYYWLRPDKTVIIGWDNAPHHKEVESFPHHKHIGQVIESSDERDLNQVLSFIHKYLQ